MANKKVCKTCRFAIWEEMDGDSYYVCGNDDSICTQEYKEGGESCERWEGEDE
jgi:hypothetical protein